VNTIWEAWSFFPHLAAHSRTSGLRNRKFSLVLITILLFSLPGFTAADGTISGRVHDLTGSPVAHIQVVIQDLNGGTARSVTAGADGAFSIFVPPGTYQITTSAPGLTSTPETVTVTGNESESADLLLEPAAAAISQDSPASNNAEAMNSKAVGDLPLNGRSASDVAGLEPGVIKARTSTAPTGPSGFGTQMAIFGGRPRQNSSTLDGINVNDYANGPLGNAVGVTLGVDALEQLAVLTSNDQPQFGRSSGGYISSSTRFRHEPLPWKRVRVHSQQRAGCQQLF
jgi:hypothetical protein